MWATSVLLAYPKSAEVDFTEASWSPTQLAEVDATDASLSNGDLLAVCRTSVSKRKLSTCFGMRNRLALRQATTPASECQTSVLLAQSKTSQVTAQPERLGDRSNGLQEDLVLRLLVGGLARGSCLAL